VDAHRATLRAFAVTVAPEMSALDEAAWQNVERTVQRALAMRPARMQRQVALLLAVIERLPLLRYGRTFSRLDPAQRTAFVEALQHAPVALVRRGVWGLRTLCFMGFYTDAATMNTVGYRADARGWQARIIS